MKRGGLGLALVWLLSAAPLFLPWQAISGRDLSPGALALLPWLVWATLPRSELDSRRLDALAVWLAAPLFVLGLALDRARDHTWSDSLLVCGGAALLVFAYAWSAQRCARTRRGRRIYAGAWFALIAGAPALRATFEGIGGALFGPAPVWLNVCARPSPLSWWHGHLHVPASGIGPGLPWAALGLALVLALLAGREQEVRA